MSCSNRLLQASFALVALVAAPATAQQDNVGHGHHLVRHGEPHPAAPDGSRFFTSRDGAVLPLPAEEDAFVFVVYGDRTGGPADGVSVLADAVHDTNLLEPDLVMTVGDLVQGYNETPEWMEQMREYKGIMSQLLCPWFPVSGNHDIYWRGDGERPVGQHEADYEMHFGPLWYAFEHKNCWFVALYSDEGNPETGEKTFDKPECQRMSDAQFEWLRSVIERAKRADHVFLFLHHPRWLGGNYGDDWDKVHRLLVDAGNVTAVFGGHIHNMRYDPKDGIEYVTLATVGGAQSSLVPSAGWLHHFNVVTVRKEQVAMSTIPVGAMMDPRAIDAELKTAAEQLAGVRPRFSDVVEVTDEGAAWGCFTASVSNPTAREIDVTLFPDSADSRWLCSPDHVHRIVGAGETADLELALRRPTGSLDAAFRPVELVLAIDYLAEGFRYSIPESRTVVPLAVDLPAPPATDGESVLALDGEREPLRVPSESLELPDGPLSLECWMNADRFGERTGLVTKTEGSEFGFFVNGGVPLFCIHLGGSYVNVSDEALHLEPGSWHHLAGVYDGRETRLYVDGKRVAAVQRTGVRRTNTLPLIIGGDVDGRANAVSRFDGELDAVRLSTVARYSGESFEPARRPAADAGTALLLNMDAPVGPWLYDESPHHAHPTLSAGASLRVEPVEVTYESKDGLPITADLYLAHGDRTTPFIVLFHQARWSRGEYRETAPRLCELGFDCLAVDQRSGGEIGGVVDQTAMRAAEQELGTSYVDAWPDLLASLEHVRERWAKGPLIAWGSSYSAALVLKLAGEHPGLVDGVIAFSPGEYFAQMGKPEAWIADSAAAIDCPVFITSARAEQPGWQPIFDAIPAGKKACYVPETAGNHGSRALWSTFADSDGYWRALDAFLFQSFLER